jgi:hypothetical protein
MELRFFLLKATSFSLFKLSLSVGILSFKFLKFDSDPLTLKKEVALILLLLLN